MSMRHSIVREQIFPKPLKVSTWALMEVKHFFNLRKYVWYWGYHC